MRLKTFSKKCVEFSENVSYLYYTDKNSKQNNEYKQEEIIVKKKLLSLMLILGMAVSAAGCGDAKAETTGDLEPQTVRIGVFTGGLDQYIAVVGKEQGIFENHGIQLEITEFAAGINTVDAIVTGQSDLGMIADFAGINRIGNTKEECNIRIIGRFTSAKNYDLYVNPDEVTTLADLAGKGIAVNPGTILEYYTALTFEEAGIGEEDQVILNVDSGQTALSVLASGEGVAYWTTGSTAKKLEEMGMTKMLTMDDLGISVDAYYVSSDSFISEHEDIVENFLSAVKETEDWILDNLEDAAAITENQIGVPQEQFIENVEASQLLLDFKQDSVDHLNKIKEWAVGAGMFDSDYEIKNYVDTTALAALFPDEVDY